jgi:hypothetical protein
VATGVSTAKPSHGRPLWLIALAALIALGGGILGSCGSTASPSASNLSGRWASDGYTCPVNVPHHETVAIVQSGSHVVATKIVGDDCVHGGHVSFLGTIIGKAGKVGFWAAQKGGVPTLGAQVQPLQVESANRFSVTFPGVGVMKFTRLSAADDSAGGSTWWLWVVLVLVLIAAAVTQAHRRRKRFLVAAP